MRSSFANLKAGRKGLAFVAPILVALMFAGGLMAQDVKLPLSAIQAKHFAQAEGLGKTQEFLNYFYDGLMNYLPKTKVAATVVGEEATVAEAANAVAVEGTILEVKKKGLIGIVRADVSLYRLSDHKLVKQFVAEVPYKPSPFNKDKNIAEPAGGRLAYMIQKELKKL